jgi:HEAT repeat protein
MLLADGGRGGTSSAHLGDRMTILVGPVRDPQACAGKIDFGTVRRVSGRTISVVAHKVEGLPPDTDAVTKAVHDLKSRHFMRRREAAERLKKMAPNARREEVARALQEALAKDDNNPFSQEEILEAFAVWGSKDSVPFLLNALAEKQDPFTREAIMKALARFQDERACEPLALHLEDAMDRREAAEALKAMGPIAEKAVLKRLQHPDHWVRWEACKILRVIGTKESLAALEKATAEREGFVGDEARGAIQAIKARRK